jgi:hypothetical protein
VWLIASVDAYSAACTFVIGIVGSNVTSPLDRPNPMPTNVVPTGEAAYTRGSKSCASDLVPTKRMVSTDKQAFLQLKAHPPYLQLAHGGNDHSLRHLRHPRSVINSWPSCKTDSALSRGVGVATCMDTTRGARIGSNCRGVRGYDSSRSPFPDSTGMAYYYYTGHSDRRRAPPELLVRSPPCHLPPPDCWYCLVRCVPVCRA